jgi:hypothetical protein
MSTITIRLMTLFAAVLVVAGCASGPKYSELAAKMPSIKSGEGRIYFYRESSMMGAAVQPDIRLNGTVVGASKPGGYFYVDRPAGSYVAAASTETEKTASFTLDAGETKYLKSAPSFGLVVGRIVITLESADKAKAELASLSNTGATAKP